jgi:hypothetical protein
MICGTSILERFYDAAFSEQDSEFKRENIIRLTVYAAEADECHH